MTALFSGLNITWGSARHGFGVQVNCFHLFCPSCSVLISYSLAERGAVHVCDLPGSHKAQQDTSHFCDTCLQGRWGMGRGLGPLNNLLITLEVSGSTSCSKLGTTVVWSGCSGTCPVRFWKSKSVKNALHLWAPAVGSERFGEKFLCSSLAVVIPLSTSEKRLASFPP